MSFDFSALEALPDVHESRERKFTADEDAALLKYWPTKNKAQVAKILGVSVNTALRRYRELCQSQH